MRPALVPILFGPRYALPSGALGVWYGDQYSTTPRPNVPNAVSSHPVTPNRNPAPRRMFNGAAFYTKSNLTVTDADAASDDGTTSASTIVGTGNWLLQRLSISLPAGAWRMRLKVRSPTGSSQDFRIGRSTAPVTKTATTSWSRVTTDFTLASPTSVTVYWAWSADGVTGATLEIDEADLFLVSEEPASDIPLSGHMMVGAKLGATDPTFGSSALHYASGGVSIVQFASKTTFDAFTATALVEITGLTAGSNGASFLASVPTLADLSAVVQAVTRPDSYFGGAEFNGARAVDGAKLMQFDGFFSLYNRGYHVVTIRCTGTKGQIFIDDILAFQSTITTASRSLWDYMVGALTSAGTNFGPIRIQSSALYPLALSERDVRAAVAHLRRRADGLGLTADLTDRVVVADGDSITGRFSYCYPYKSLDNLSPAALGINVAIGGDNMLQIKARKQQVIDIIPPDRGSRKFIYTLLTTNDMAAGYTISGSPYAGSRDAWLDDVFAHCDGLRAAGYILGLGTITPRASATNPAFNTDRAWARTQMLAAVGTHCDFVIDFGNDPDYGQDADASDVAKYSDGTHPTDATQTLMEVTWRTAVNLH